MIKATKIIFQIIVLILLILAGAIVYLPIYLDGHKDLLEKAASQALGRTVEIGGDVNLVWALQPSIAVEGIRIKHADPAKTSPLASAKRVEIQFDFGALLDRRITITHLVVSQATASLDMVQHDKNDWIVGPSDQSKVSLQIESIEVRDSTLDFKAIQDSEYSLSISQLELIGLGGNTLKLKAALSYRDTPFAVIAIAGQEDTVTEDRWPFTVGTQTGDATLDVKGSTNTPFDSSGLEAQFDLASSSLRPLELLVAVDGLPEGSFQIGFQLSKDETGYRLRNMQGSLVSTSPLGQLAITTGEAVVSADQALTANLDGSWQEKPVSVKLSLSSVYHLNGDQPRRNLDLAASLGDTALKGALKVMAGKPRPKITGELDFTKINFPELSALVQSYPKQSKPWSEQSLPIAALNTIDADLTVKAKRIMLQRFQVDDLQSQISLKDGRLRLDQFSAPLPGLHLTGKATFDPKGKSPTLTVALDAEQVQLPKAVLSFAPAFKAEGNLEKVSLRSKTQGETPKALLKKLSGELVASSARLNLPGQQVVPDSEIKLTSPSVTFSPGKAVRLQTDFAVGQHNLSLELSGGSLAKLLSEDQPWPNIELVAHGKRRGQEFEILGDLGPLSAVLGGRDLNVDLAVYRSGFKASIVGKLARFTGLQDSAFDFKASGTSFSLLNALLDTRLPAKQSFDVAAHLESGGDQRLAISDLKATVGNSDLQGDLSIDLGSNKRFEATLTARYLDLAPYLDGLKNESSDVDNMLSARLPLDSLHTLEGTLRLQAGHVRFEDLGFDDGQLEVALDGGHLRLSLNAGQERLTTSVELKPTETQWKLNFAHTGKLDLGWLIDHPDAPSRLPATFDVQLSSVGNSLQQMLGSVDGYFELTLGAGQLDRKVASLPLLDIVFTLLGTVNPANLGNSFTDLQCAAFQFDIDDGIAISSQGVAVQTESVNAIGSGALNLNNSEIEFRFETNKRKGIGIDLLGIADRFIVITGTLWEPAVAIDPKQVLLHGGAAWATGGLSLLFDKAISRLSTSSNPCDDVIRQPSK
ncbi:MAG: AsmA family protein [Candidatus Competibacteraceae bacterium]|nr:AsmA family protein [Candidatus Competibacteraceae bacterium]